MQCQYCDSHIDPIPSNGLCPNCGAALPAKSEPQPPAPPPVQHVNDSRPGITCCQRCYSQNIRFQKQGFRWGLALLGLFLLPPFGILFGLIGRNDLRYTCNACGNSWKR